MGKNSIPLMKIDVTYGLQEVHFVFHKKTSKQFRNFIEYIFDNVEPKENIKEDEE